MPGSALVTNAGQPYGTTAVIQVTEAFKNTGAATINSGDAVILEIPADTGEAVGGGVVTTTTADSNRCIGIAIEEIKVGEVGLVCIWGVVKGANVATAAAAGDLLSTSATAGRLATSAGTGLGSKLGIALTAGSSNKADVFVFKA